MLSRLETMVLMGMDLPLPAIQRQIASGLDIIVHLGRLRDKTRKVLEVTEVLGYWEEEIHLQTLYCFEEAYKELDKLSADEKKRLEYEARQKAIRDRDILIKTGENRGRKEIILSMIEAGLPLEQIAEIAKETLETIQELKKKMG